MKREKMKLSECCASISDGDHQPPPKAEAGVPFITISNINSSNQIDYTNTMFVPQQYYDQLDNKRKAQVGDVLYSVVGSFGIPVLMKTNTPFVFQRHIAILRPNYRILPAFLFYTMLNKDFYAKADAVAIGAAQRTISLSALRDIEITVPSLEVQNEIVKKLTAYDSLIENNQKQIKLLEEAAQRLYKEWFVDLRFPGYKDTPVVDGVPEGWEKTEIDSHISLCSGYAFKSKDFNDNGEYGIITIKNVKDGQFDSDSISRITEIPKQMPDFCKLVEGDILLSLTGNVGRVCLVFGEGYLLNQRVAKLQSNHSAFTYCLFRSKDMFDTMNNMANGAAQQNLSPIRTGKLKVVFPEERVMSLFESIAAPMIQKIIVLNKNIQFLTKARDFLLPRLMSGEMEV